MAYHQKFFPAKKYKWTVIPLTMIKEMLLKRRENDRDNIVIVTGQRGEGKCQTKGSKVLMSNGEWKNIEDINIGDEVISPQEDNSINFSKVINIHNRFENDIYDIVESTRNKNKLYSCSYNHEIPVIVPISNRTSKDDSTPRKTGRRVKIWDARKISNSKYYVGSHICSFTCPEIEYKGYENSKIEPYSLGVFLGDGSFSSIRKEIYYKNRSKSYNILSRGLNITSNDFEIIEEVSKHYPIMSITKKQKTNAKNYRFSLNGEFASELIRLDLEGKGSGNKFIPKECLLSSLDYRRKLLAGLIDTDGFVSDTNQMSITTKSKIMSEDIKNLVFSLGGYSSIRKIKKKCQTGVIGEYYHIRISFKDPFKIPLLTKKKNRFRIRQHNPRNIGIKSIKSKSSEVYGIEIEGNSKYYITDNYMVTHNSTLAGKILFQFEDFNPFEQIVYSKEELLKQIKNKDGYILCDEAVVSASRGNVMTRANKILHEILTINRSNRNILFMLIPSIEDFDIKILQYCSLWLFVDTRGYAIMFMPENKGVFGRKNWDIEQMKKLYEEFMKENKKVSKMPYWCFNSFRGSVRFGKLTKQQQDIMDEIKNVKKNQNLDKEMQNETVVEVKELKNYQKYSSVKLAEMVMKGEIRDMVVFKNQCTELKLDLDRTLKDVDSILRRNNINKSTKGLLKEYDKQDKLIKF